MELIFLALMIVLLITALGSGYPVAFAIPGSAILSIALAALAGELLTGDPDAYFVHGGGPDAWLSAGVLNLRRIYRSDDIDILIAIPLFIFMGLMLQRSKVAEELLLAMTRLFGSLRGGLGVSVVLVGALLAATTSVIGATVVAMGMISLPTMLRANYSKPLAAGTVAATGTLGQIIPPSIVLIILNHQLTSAVYQANSLRSSLYKANSSAFSMPSEFSVSSVSMGEMFMGALVPGLILVGLYILFLLATGLLRPGMAPASREEATGDLGQAAQLALALIPPLVLILLVLGSIIYGVATVNQAGAIGAAGATVMAGYRLWEGQRRAHWPMTLAVLSTAAIWLVINAYDVNLRKIQTSDDLFGTALAAIASLLLLIAVCWSAWRVMKTEQTLKFVVEETTKTTAMVFAILLGAAMLTAAFRAFGGEVLVKDFLGSVPGGFWGQFGIVMLVIFGLGFFLDFIEITVVVVPIVAPVILADPTANVSALWFGVMLALVLQTSFLTPPFGFALFYLRGVAPTTIRTLDIYKGVVPFIALQLLAIGIVVAVPRLVDYLPYRFLLLSENAPPTTNPKLQFCLEEYVYGRFENDGSSIRIAIEEARKLDISSLPDDLQTEFLEGLSKADRSFAAMRRINNAEEALAQAAKTYRPVFVHVRDLERDIARLDREVSRLDQTIARAGQALSDREGTEMQSAKAEAIAEREALLSNIPSDWESLHSAFSDIRSEERDARISYRRLVDEAYEPIQNIRQLLADVDQLTSFEPSLHGLIEVLQANPPASSGERIDAFKNELKEISGTNAIESKLTKASRALKNSPPDRAAAVGWLIDALDLFNGEVAWRSQAASQLGSRLVSFDEAIHDTIGLRSQPRLPDNVAKEVAACVARTQDISLNF